MSIVGRCMVQVAIMLFIGTSVAAAHHSFSMFDAEKTVTLRGVVTDWQWTNPHVWLIVTVKDENGESHEWGLEGQSPAVLRQQGYLRASVKPGEEVIVNINPRRDGSYGGAFLSVTDLSGRPLNQQP